MRSPTFALLVAALSSSVACTLLTSDTGPDAGTPGKDAGRGTDGASGGAQLPVDCGNTANLHDPACTSPVTNPNTTLGKGPRFVDTLDVVHPGFTDTGRIIVGLGTASGGVILAVDVTTGDRTVISGPTVGTGAALPAVWGVQPGPDGWYALGNGSVWRVDPSTGNRTKVWDTTMGDSQCSFSSFISGYDGSAGGIAVATDGTIYLPITTQQGNDIGAGVIAVHAGTCKLVSHTGYPTSLNHGTGPDVIGIADQFALRGSTLVVETGGAIGSIDLATGNRTSIATDAGDSSMVLSSDGKTSWSACSFSGDGAFVSVDVTSGTSKGIDPYPSTPLSIGGPWCTVWMHPSKPLLVVEDANGFALFDPATGNSNMLSY